MRRCRFAQYDETLWLDVLRHYTAKGDECATQIQELLELIEESRALPPLMVVEALASGPDTTLAVCQDYLERQFAEDFKVVQEDRTVQEEYRLDTAAAQSDMDAQLKEMRRTGRRGLAAGAMALTDSPTKYFLRLHAEHLESIGLDPRQELQGGGGGGAASHAEFQEQMQRIGPRPGAGTRAPLQKLLLQRLLLLLPLAGACLHGV